MWLGRGQHTTWVVQESSPLGRIRPWRVVILCVSAWSRRPVSPLRCGTPSWYGLGTPRRDTFRAEYRKSVPTSMRCNRWTANNRSGTASWRISFRRAKPFPITMITVSIAVFFVGYRYGREIMSSESFSNQNEMIHFACWCS